jgi:hypothetical protein
LVSDHILKYLKMPIHLIRLSSDIVEDSFEEGLQDSTGCGYSGEAIGKSFANEAKAIAYLADVYGYPSDVALWEIGHSTMETAKHVADHSNAQNGGWMEPTDQEFETWTKGLGKLYEEQVTVSFLRH